MSDHVCCRWFLWPALVGPEEGEGSSPGSGWNWVCVVCGVIDSEHHCDIPDGDFWRWSESVAETARAERPGRVLS